MMTMNGKDHEGGWSILRYCPTVRMQSYKKQENSVNLLGNRVKECRMIKGKVVRMLNYLSTTPWRRVWECRYSSTTLYLSTRWRWEFSRLRNKNLERYDCTSLLVPSSLSGILYRFVSHSRIQTLPSILICRQQEWNISERICVKIDVDLRTKWLVTEYRYT
jgi:hypothetical protein